MSSSTKSIRTLHILFFSKMVVETYHNGLLDGLLNLHALASDGLIQFPFKSQEVHVSLGLGDEVSDLKEPNVKSRDSKHPKAGNKLNSFWGEGGALVLTYPLWQNLVGHFASFGSKPHRGKDQRLD